MNIQLGVPRPGGDTGVVIISVCKYLCRIYYVFKKESKCVVVVEKEKDARVDKDEICAHKNVSGKSIQGNK